MFDHIDVLFCIALQSIAVEGCNLIIILKPSFFVVRLFQTGLNLPRTFNFYITVFIACGECILCYKDGRVIT